VSCSTSIVTDDWLSHELGRPVAHLIGTEPGQMPSGPSFVDARVPTSEVAAVTRLEDAGFRVVDAAVTLERPRCDDGGSLASARFAEPGDAGAVRAIASTALTQSRFHLDPEIPDEAACALKASWAGNFFTGDRGDWMVVAQVDGVASGFLQLLDRPDALVIDLVAVSRDHQGKGLGAAMIRFASAHCGSAPLLRVGTQAANVRSLGFYGSLGFRIVRTEYVLHRHGA